MQAQREWTAPLPRSFSFGRPIFLGVSVNPHNGLDIRELFALEGFNGHHSVSKQGRACHKVTNNINKMNSIQLLLKQ